MKIVKEWEADTSKAQRLVEKQLNSQELFKMSTMHTQYFKNEKRMKIKRVNNWIEPIDGEFCFNQFQ